MLNSGEMKPMDRTDFFFLLVLGLPEMLKIRAIEEKYHVQVSFDITEEPSK